MIPKLSILLILFGLSCNSLSAQDSKDESLNKAMCQSSSALFIRMTVHVLVNSMYIYTRVVNFYIDFVGCSLFILVLWIDQFQYVFMFVQ